jgi:hypothetical protein
VVIPLPRFQTEVLDLLILHLHIKKKLLPVVKGEILNLQVVPGEILVLRTALRSALQISALLLVLSKLVVMPRTEVLDLLILILHLHIKKKLLTAVEGEILNLQVVVGEIPVLRKLEVARELKLPFAVVNLVLVSRTQKSVCVVPRLLISSKR